MSHPWRRHRAGAMPIIVTVRRVEDALASWFTAFDAIPEDQSLQIMRNWLKLFAQLRAHSLIVPYEQIGTISMACGVAHCPLSLPRGSCRGDCHRASLSEGRGQASCGRVLCWRSRHR